MLEIRFNELYDIVDKFIITESELTHSGMPKPLYLKDNLNKFEKYKDKIIIHTVKFNQFGKENDDNWARERHQRDAALDVLKNIANDNDYVMISDADEIPNVDAIKCHILKNTDSIGVFDQNRFMYFLNYKNISTNEPQCNSRIARYKTIKQTGLCSVRYCDRCGDEIPYYTIPNGGWHFTFMGGAEKVKQKVQSFAHQEYNKPEKINKIPFLIEQGKDVYSAKTDWIYVDIDKTFPKLIQENKESYLDKNWIKEIKKQKPKIYDCFIFFNELDILEIRLNELYDVVDRFVIVEARKTHGGKDKPLYFNENLNRFSKFLNKITYSVIEDFPFESASPWQYQGYQRAYIMNNLKDCQDDDMIIFSDCDEIPKASTIKSYPHIMSFSQTLYYYDFNTMAKDKWNKAKILPFKDFKIAYDKNQDLTQYVRDVECEKIKDGGWHFSYFSDLNGVMKKLTSFSHQNDFKHLKDCDVSNLIKEQKDIFGNKLLNIESNNLPKYVMENINSYNKFFRKPKSSFCFIIQATGKYYELAVDLLNSIEKFMCPGNERKVIILTENPSGTQQYKSISVSEIKPPTDDKNTCLFIFDYILHLKNIISDYNYVYKIDADMILCDYVQPNEITPDKSFIGIQHFNNTTQKDNNYVPKTCSAYIPENERNTPAWQSCIFGGKTECILKMSEELKNIVHSDIKNGVNWGAWEEPYVNWYFNKNLNEVKTLPPIYATPIHWYKMPEDFKNNYKEKTKGLEPKIYHFNKTTWEHSKKIDKIEMAIEEIPKKESKLDQLFSNSMLIWEKPLEVTVTISTKDRYYILPLAILAIANQTKLPQYLIIYDDGEGKDLRNDSLYLNLFHLLDKKGIKWSVQFGQKKGQVLNHQKAIKDAQTDLIWRLDDDAIPEPDVLEKLLKLMKPDVGAIGSLILLPLSDNTYYPSTGKIENINLEPNVQWFRHPKNDPIEVEHLNNSFLFRKEAAQHGYQMNLSPVGFREETLFSYGIKRNGWKVLVDPTAVIWHMQAPFGGIRSHNHPEWYKQDDKIFKDILKSWEIVEGKLIVLDNGLGDHIVFRTILPEIKKKYPKLTLATCFPDVFKDDDVKQISIAHAKQIGSIEQYNVYNWCVQNGWEGTLVDAMRKIYL